MQLPKINRLTKKKAGPDDAPVSKAARLKQKLVREAVICGAAVAGIAAAMYFVEDWARASTDRRDQLSSAVSQVTGAIASLEQQLSKAEKSLPVFEKVFKDADKLEIELDRRSATEVLERLRDEYLFSSLRIGMSPVKNMEEAAYKTPFAIGQQVEMELNIEALSDEHIMNFLKQLQTDLPGKVKVTHLDISRETVPTAQVFVLVSQSGRVGLVSANVRVLWLGVRPPPPPAGVAPAAGG